MGCSVALALDVPKERTRATVIPQTVYNIVVAHDASLDFVAVCLISQDLRKRKTLLNDQHFPVLRYSSIPSIWGRFSKD